MSVIYFSITSKQLTIHNRMETKYAYHKAIPWCYIGYRSDSDSRNSSRCLWQDIACDSLNWTEVTHAHTRLFSSGFKFEPLNSVPTIMNFTVIALCYEV